MNRTELITVACTLALVVTVVFCTERLRDRLGVIHLKLVEIAINTER